MLEIIYSNEAVKDLDEIYSFIALDSKDTAKSYLLKMGERIKKLSDFSNIGFVPKYKELAELGIRILVIDNYLVFYKVAKDKNQIHIVRIRNSLTNYINLF